MEATVEYNQLALAAVGNGIVAVGRMLPVMAGYGGDGSQRWHRKAEAPFVEGLEEKRLQLVEQWGTGKIEFVHFGEVVAPFEDGFVVNYSRRMRLDCYDASGSFVESFLLQGGDGHTLWPRGIAVLHDAVYVPIDGRLWRVRRTDRPVSGSVVDELGRPVAGATVTITPIGRPATTLHTDASGAFPMAADLVTRWLSVVVAEPAHSESERHGNGVEVVAAPFVLSPRPRVCVRVTSKEDGAPVTRFEVSLARRLASGDSTRTDQGPRAAVEDVDGTHCLEAPWRPPYLVRVSADGYADATARILENREITLALEPEAVLVLSVEDADGGAVAGADVSVLTPLVATRTAQTGSAGGVTDEAGELSLHGLQPGEWHMRVAAAGHPVMLEPISLPTGVTREKVTLVRGESVAVAVVREPSGEGAEGADVWVTPLATTPGATAMGRTDARGRCDVAGLAEGRYRISASWHDVMVEQEATLDHEGQQFTLRLPSGGPLRGRVRGGDGYRGIIAWAATEGWRSADAPVAGEGFVIDGVPLKEDVRVVLASGSMALAESRTRLEGPSGADVTLEVAPGFDVTGSVTHGSEACVGCALLFQRLGGGRAGISTITDRGGRYTLRVPGPESYSVAITDAQSGRAHQRTMTVESDMAWDVTLDSQTVVGRVVEESTGAPVEDATVTLRCGARSIASRISDTDGRWWFDGLGPGDYELIATAGDRGARRSARVAEVPVEVTIELPAGGRVVLDVRDIAGSPVPGAGASLYSADGSEVDVPPGGGLRAGADPATVVLGPGCRLTVEAASVRNGVVRLLDTTGLPLALARRFPPGWVPFAGPQATYLDLPAGPAMVEVPSGGRVSRVAVTLQPERSAIARLP